MKMITSILAALSLLLLSACTSTDDEEKTTDNAQESKEPAVMFPNYLVINAPSKDPDRRWYVSDYFRKVEQWEPETTDYSGFKMGMYELTQYPNQAPTPAQQEAADKFVQDSFDAVLRHGWLSKEKGLSDGYEKMFGDPVHYVNVEYVFDGETLNPDKPEVLMYYKTKEGEFLLGVMYLAIGTRGPQVGGPLSKWHYHIDRRMCYERGVLPIGTVQEDGSCDKGFPNVRSPEMLHVWFFDHPEGKYATTMGLSEQLLNLGIRQVREWQDERM